MIDINKINFNKLVLLIIIVSVAGIFFILNDTKIYAQTVPSPPIGLTATSISASSISLSWFPPQNDGGSPITGYKIEYKTPASSYVAFTTSMVTTYTHTNLSTGTTYTYRVFAINSVGTSSSSNTASAKPAQVKTVPDPPVKLTATVISPTTVILSWYPPKNNGGSTITEYKIEYKTTTSSYVILPSNGTVTKYTQTGLSVGTTYIYRVSAVNNIGTSKTSVEAVATPKNISAKNMPPDPPTGLVAIVSSPTSISLSWHQPKNNGGSPITGYKIEYKIGTNQYLTLVANTGNVMTSYIHEGLATGAAYTYRVSAINSVGTSNPSAKSSVTTNLLPLFPEKPQHTPVLSKPTGPNSTSSSKSIIISTIESPLKQLKSGILTQDIKCKQGLQLILRKSNNMPACVTYTSFEKLLSLNWGLDPSKELTAEGLKDTYKVGEQIDFVMKFNELIGDCTKPHVLVKSQTNQTIWESKFVAVPCSSDLTLHHAEGEMNFGNSELGYLRINQTGSYYIHIWFAKEITRHITITK